jgi:uncharacterized membrane protein YphA (DoxX/SURF4 family)
MEALVILRVAIGVLLVGAGLYSLILNKKAAASGAAFHERWRRVVPWVYRIPPANLATSERAWRPLAIAGGLLLIVGGAMFIAGVVAQ